EGDAPAEPFFLAGRARLPPSRSSLREGEAPAEPFFSPGGRGSRRAVRSPSARGVFSYSSPSGKGWVRTKTPRANTPKAARQEPRPPGACRSYRNRLTRLRQRLHEILHDLLSHRHRFVAALALRHAPRQHRNGDEKS